MAHNYWRCMAMVECLLTSSVLQMFEFDLWVFADNHSFFHVMDYAYLSLSYLTQQDGTQKKLKVCWAYDLTFDFMLKIDIFLSQYLMIYEIVILFDNLNLIFKYQIFRLFVLCQFFLHHAFCFLFFFLFIIIKFYSFYDFMFKLVKYETRLYYVDGLNFVFRLYFLYFFIFLLILHEK